MEPSHARYLIILRQRNLLLIPCLDQAAVGLNPRELSRQHIEDRQFALVVAERIQLQVLLCNLASLLCHSNLFRVLRQTGPRIGHLLGDLIARMKLIPVHDLIEDRKLLLIDDSIVRGTQLRETTEFLYQSGAKEVHVRPACPPLLYGCKYLNFSRSKSELDLITRRIIREWEGDNDVNVLSEYADPNSDRYAKMLDEICRIQNFTSLRYHRLDDLIESIGLDACKVCTYCFDGRE